MALARLRIRYVGHGLVSLGVVGTAILTLSGCAISAPLSVSYQRILFLGNSLTLHGPSADIGWSGNWGMAASDIAKDYAHVLSGRFPDATHEEMNIAAFEGGYRGFDLHSLDALLQRQPDLVIIEVGDNVADSSDYPSYYAQLLDYVRAKTHGVLVCTSTWFGKGSIDAANRSACATAGGRFVDLSAIYRDARNQASAERSFENSGVGGHPGDRGMAAIAEAIYKAAAF